MDGHYLKICGNTNIEDVRLVGASGADFCGIVVNIAWSERSLSLQRAVELVSESKIPSVILICDLKVEEIEEVVAEIKPFAIQLLGHESPELVRELKSAVKCRIWKTVHLPLVSGEGSPEEYVKAGADALLIDSVDTSEGFQRLGGTGKVADWKTAAAIIKAVSIPVFLAGGINPENVEKAITEVRPYGIDLCSGVEASRGKKDPEKLRNLVNNFRSAIEKFT
jgi:phosphoribosylanthranilate isomerase